LLDTGDWILDAILDVILSVTADPPKRKRIFAVACISCIDNCKDAYGMTQYTLRRKDAKA
jgi:hypothetical protein